MQNELGAQCGDDDVGHTMVSGTGQVFGALPGPYTLTPPAGFQHFSDQLLPASSGLDELIETAFTGTGTGTCSGAQTDVGVLQWKTKEVLVGTGALTSNVQSRAMYLGFPLELIADARDRRQLMAEFLHFCDPTCAPDVPFHVELRNQTVTGTETHYACNSMGVGEAYTVAPGGKLTLSTNNVVVLENGFSVGTGAELVVETRRQ